MNDDQFQSAPTGQPGQAPQVLNPAPDQSEESASNSATTYIVLAAAAVLFMAAIIITVLAFAQSKPSTKLVEDKADNTVVEAVDTPAVASDKTAIVELGKDGPSPDSLTITPGGSVVWKNTTDAPRTLSGDQIGSNNVVEKGSSFSFVYSQPGDYTYTDGTHQATVTVKE